MGGEPARAAVILLGELGSRPELRGQVPSSVIRALEREIRGRDPQAAGLALLALGKIGGTADEGKIRARALELLQTELRKGDGVTRPYAALAIGLMGQSFDTSDRAREDMREVLRLNFEKKAHRVARRDLGAHVLALGMLRDEEVRPAIRTLAKRRGELPRLRGSAVLALGMIGDERDRTTLRMLLEARGPEDRRLRFDTCVAAGLLGGEEIVSALNAIFGDPRSSLFSLNSASLAIAHLGRPESVETLIKLVRAERAPPMNRAMAIVALGHLVDTSDVPALRRLAVESNHRALAPTVEAILRSQ
jgi:HEAT repeat protein